MMETSTALTANVQTELARRHKATKTTILSLLVAVFLLCILAFVSTRFLTERNNSPLHMPVLITILIFGLGAIAFRRTKFATMRLQDIAALQGASGLLISLQRATLQVALIAAAVAVIGFVATLLTGDASYTYRAGVVAAGILLYCYPVRYSWEQAVRRFTSENEPNPAENPS